MAMTAPLDKLEAHFNRFMMSHLDIDEARQYLNALQELPWDASPIIRRALLTSAVVAYSRPFSGNENHPNATSQLAVKLDEWFSDAQKTLHQKVIDLRNEAVAHSGL